MTIQLARPAPIAVTLDREALAEGVAEGIRRRMDGLEGKNQPRYGAKESGVGLWDQDINGACAECAFAQWIGEPWTGRDDGKNAVADVGLCWQVRWTPYHDGHLNVWQYDKPDHFYVLVTGWDGHYDLRGWMAGSQAMDQQWWRTRGLRNPAFWVPQSAPLRAMELVR